MKRLQRFLAIPMGATAVACIWLLYRQAGPRGLVVALIAGAVLTALLIWYGFAQRRDAKDGWVILPLAIAVAVVAAWQVPPRVAAPASIAGAEEWSEARTASYLAQGKPVFVYFTADWCLTCKVNEEAAIDRAEVREAFRRGGVIALAGDWTNGDPAITRFLEGRGRAGVPYYLWYAPGKPPEELPQILTPSMLISRAQATAKR
jgi:thiol:disulfide interchange protein